MAAATQTAFEYANLVAELGEHFLLEAHVVSRLDRGSVVTKLRRADQGCRELGRRGEARSR